LRVQPDKSGARLNLVSGVTHVEGCAVTEAAIPIRVEAGHRVAHRVDEK